MRSISDDGKCIGTEDEVKAYEESQKFDGEIAQQIGEYLDSIKITKGEDKRNLTRKEFARRENVIKDWIRWDRKQRPERYQKEEEPIVSVSYTKDIEF